MILAQTGDGGLPDTGRNPVEIVDDLISSNKDFLNHPQVLIDIVTEISIVWAVILVIVGALCIMNGYRWHKAMIILLAGMSGMWIGTLFGDHLGSSRVVAACLAVLLALLAWPLLRYAVALFGGLAGAFVGANVWTAIGQDPSMHTMGALVGLVAFGMLAFLAFRGVVIALTTVGGSCMLVLGALAAMVKVDTWRSGIEQSILDNPLLVPIVALSAAVIGGIFQLAGGVKGLNDLADKADPVKQKKAKAA